MIRTLWTSRVLVGLLSVVALFGCQQRPTAVPTLAIAPTEPVVLVVVTATSQPTLAPTSTTEATITPIPTLTPQITATLTATVETKATAAPTQAAVAPTADQTQSVPTVEPTAPPPTNFGAPQAISPQGTAFRDGDTIKATFTSVGPLAPDQCYRVDVTLGNPTGPGGVGDYWVGMCGNQANAGDTLRFDIKPGRFRDEPNYGTLLVSADSVIPPTPEYVMNWYVTVVRMMDASDPVHPNVEALSAPSVPLQNTFFR